jgi:hypothetical protein
MRSATISGAAMSLLLLNLICVPRQQLVRASSLPAADSQDGRSSWVARNNLGTFVRKMIGGQAACLEANDEQAVKIKHRDPSLALNPLTPESGPSQDYPAINLRLRGTSQLRDFPAASEAFKRVAAQWESLIQTPVTIIIDVDFGPTLFGSSFGDDVVASSDAQVIEGNALYSAVRADLISRAFEPESIALYNTLPSRYVPTTEGTSTGIATSTANLRALGLIDQNADPVEELSSFGLPPAIALNSKFTFDFEPADGIAPGQLDFEAIVSHEVGHILGFISCVGQREIDFAAEAQPSIWDLFRVRPEAIRDGVSTAQRILTPGGEQAFFNADSGVSLSTGRPDGSGGDGRQPAHWKDDSLSGRYLGIMDPTVGIGDHYYLTNDDAAVLSALGYQARSLTETITLIPLISGQPQNSGMIAPPPNAGVLSHLQYSIKVPAGAQQLEIDLIGNQDVDLFARFGQRVFIEGFHPETDYVSAGDTGVESITITSASSPALRPGIYFIAVANFGPGDAVYSVKATVSGGKNSNAPAVFHVKAHLEGDSIFLDYSAVDLDKDAVRAELTIADQSGRSLAPASSFAIGNNTTRFESQVSLGGLSGLPTATTASLILIDRDDNRSPEVSVDFSGPEAGGLTLLGASFGNSRLIIRTGGLDEDLAVEINGRVVAPPRAIKIKGATKVVIKGDPAQLGLRNGPNRIRVKNSKGWSNILIFNL